MTTYDSNALAATGGLSFLGRIAAALRSWNDVRVTRNALSRLSLRELDDIGLTPDQIEEVARRGAR